MSDISILICTRNRADSLRATLASIGESNLPHGLIVELVVIDNASEDDTLEAIQTFRPDNGIVIRYVLEPSKGQCHARNAGIRRSLGRIILFTDDDVRVPSCWIEQMCLPILRGEVDAIVGAVTPAPHLRTEWLVKGFPSFVACTREPIEGCEPLLTGANMAFSRDVLERVPGFDTNLGPGALGFGDETLFSRQLLKAGYRIRAEPTIAVEHHFDPTRLTNEECKNTAQKMGQSEAYVFYHWEHGNPFFWRWANVLRGTFGLLRKRLSGAPGWSGPDVPAYWKFSLITARAFLRQYLKERGKPRLYEQFGLVKKNPELSTPLASTSGHAA